MKTSKEFPDAGSRRGFIKKVGLAGLAAPFLPLRYAEGAPAPRGAPEDTAAAGPVRFHVFARAFDQLSFAEGAAVAAEAGYAGIDLTVRAGGRVLPERVEEDLPKAVEAARAAGLTIEMITTDITDPRAGQTELILRTAAKLGVRYYRLGNFRYDRSARIQDTLKTVKSALTDIAAINREFGLHGAIQNHAGVRVSAPVWDLFVLFQDIDPRWIGCQYDPRHAMVEGTQSWPLGLELISPWVRSSVVKDFRWKAAGGDVTPENVPIGEGIIDFDQYFGLVRKFDIEGPVSFHFPYGVFRTDAWRTPAGRREMIDAMKQDRRALRPSLARHGLA